MRSRLFILAFAVLFPVIACAQPTKPAQPAKPAAAEDEDVKFEESIRNFGFVSGAAYQCLPDAERTAHDRLVAEQDSST